ncbi:MAG: hypothetical protein CFE38_09815 [Comamonadaceae bacterium PBBC1]|nr:MAG: hypothetical protein CFE38_09815 [Comamonadaceae bacterium PBBC1]
MLVAVLDQSTAPTLIQFVDTNFGGFMEVTLFGSETTFDSLASFNQLVGGVVHVADGSLRWEYKMWSDPGVQWP